MGRKSVPRVLKPIVPSVALMGMTEQVAEKGLRESNGRYRLSQGLKPESDLSGFTSPAQAVPLLQSALNCLPRFGRNNGGACKLRVDDRLTKRLEQGSMKDDWA
jgi:hypothetical protein